MSAPRPDVGKTLARLKDFQLRSAEYVFRRLYLDQDQVDRFLLADEVGLGKTLVARGVIARAVDHLWDSVKRIDIVYICSNADIARQNINRLQLDGQESFAFASRLTLLPLHARDLKRKLNFISFTPGTSFELGSRGGIMKERALLYYMLKEVWGLHGVGPKNALQGGAGTRNWREYLKWFRGEERSRIELKLKTAFVGEVERATDLRKRFEELCDGRADRAARDQVVGELRRLLARCCVKELEPDLVILDEFQRFRQLLDGDDEVAMLAQELFSYRAQGEKAGGERARVLLLSATPYKMYTLANETEDDHYRDFRRTTDFLFGHDARCASEFERELGKYRAALCLGDSSERLDEARSAVERRLRRVMCRTERLGVSADRNGMLEEVPTPARPFEASDALGFALIDQVASRLGAIDCVELWKSGAYLLNFMEDYDLKRRLTKAIKESDAELGRALRSAEAALLRVEAVQRYERIDSGNARLRALAAESVDRGGWKLLWMPPSMPYYEPAGAFGEVDGSWPGKALIFSSWKVVPKAIAVMASYEAERRMVRSADPEVTYDQLRERQTPLLRFAKDNDRLTGLPVLTLLYPCATLASEVDPLTIGRRLAERGRLGTATEVMAETRASVERLLAPLLEARGSREGAPDEQWYWAAPLLLDRDRCPGMRVWLQGRDDWAWRYMAGKDDINFEDHVEHARRFFEEPGDLGPPPADLAEVLAKVAIGSPAVAALRALRRRWAEPPDAPPAESAQGDEALVEQRWKLKDSPPLAAAAGWIAMGFRSLFNRPETILLLRGIDRAEPYWERVLDYAVHGNLQSVMDEYVHVLVEGMGLEKAGKEAALPVSERINDAVALRTVALSHDEIVLEPAKLPSLQNRRMRCRYAMRFGDGEPEAGEEATREDQVRSAFNSPFRPFILASTSIGQEGLDFHLYCHAVYHWNLPSNPVDLEQREGRVHRFKGHAIRKNLARKYGLAATTGAGDPWDALFGRAVADRKDGTSDLEPYWVLDGPWKIQRRVPLFPLSREAARLDDLKRSLALYRLAFGQPRQEELVGLLGERLRKEEIQVGALGRYHIDLSPPSK